MSLCGRHALVTARVHRDDNSKKRERVPAPAVAVTLTRSRSDNSKKRATVPVPVVSLSRPDWPAVC